MGYNSITISHLSLQYVGVPVSATQLTGAPFNPTSSPVQMAFMPQATQVPQNADWQTALWATSTTNLIYPYTAYCLIGPGGTVQLGIGTYAIYLKVSASPEIPVMQASLQLEIY